MEIVKFLGAAVVVVVLVLIIGAVITHWLERKVVQNRYQWLLVLDLNQWKHTRQIRADMSRLKREKVWGPLIYTDLARLEEEGLVEAHRVTEEVERYPITMRVYRLTPSGTHRRKEDGER